MEKTHLCSSCGERIDESEKYCSKCGAVNYYNVEILERTISEIDTYSAKAKKSVDRFNTLRAIGAILISLSILVSVVFAFMAIGGKAYNMIGILPINGIAFTVGLAMVFIFKTN